MITPDKLTDEMVRAHAVELLRCAADLVIAGDPFPVLEAERRLGIGRTDSARVLALQARDFVGGERTEVQLLESAALLESGWPAINDAARSVAKDSAAVQVQCPGCGANQTDGNGACHWCKTVYRTPKRAASKPADRTRAAARKG